MHWGQLHLLTRERLAERYPRSDDVIRIRRELDPQRLFPDDRLRPLFA